METAAIRFNPYRVFKFVATKGFCLMPGDVVMFQSLSGFQVRCNATIDIATLVILLCFNPYRVFKFVATERRRWIAGFGYDVSIPIGFSSSLQHKS